MIHLPKVVWKPILAATSVALLLPCNVAAQNAQIRHVAVVHKGATTEIQIETSKRLLPLTQVITDPDRLVIDFADAVPGPEVRPLAVNQGEVKSVRTSLVSANPAMTRVVIDLKSAQDFELVPSGTSVTVKLAGSGANASPNTTPAAAAQPVREAAAVPVPSAAPVAVARVAPTPTAAAPVAAAPVAKKAVVSEVVRPTITVERTPVIARSPLTATSADVSSTQARMAPATVVSTTPGRASRTGTQTAQIRRIAVLKSGGATEIEIEASQRIVPTTQLITGPDRLVLDFAGSLPGPRLRALVVNQGEVKGVRTGLLSSNPPVTRVVLDLKSPQEFQLFPSGNSVIVKLPGSMSGASAPPASNPAVNAAPAPPPEQPKKVISSLQGGLLSLTSTKGSLADVLNEFCLQTGAEIAVPAGAEREEVAASLGPASPREVLTQLLNGSRYNFIIVGSDSDANKVDRVILTPKTAGDMRAQSEPGRPEPDPVAQITPPGAPPARPGAPAPTPSAVPPTDDGQPQGDSMPPDIPPQSADPQPAPN